MESLFTSLFMIPFKRMVEKEETIHISKVGQRREENVREGKRGEKWAKSGLVRRGAGTGTLENRMECSKLFKASGRRPRRGRRIFVARAMASGIRLLNVFIAFERVRSYTQPCKPASRTFAFESCATYINWLSSLPSSFVFCSFPSIIVNTSFAYLVAFHFFNIPLRETRVSTHNFPTKLPW